MDATLRPQKENEGINQHIDPHADATIDGSLGYLHQR